MSVKLEVLLEEFDRNAEFWAGLWKRYKTVGADLRAEVWWAAAQKVRWELHGQAAVDAAKNPLL